METATSEIFGSSCHNSVKTRLLFDTGSQRSYITTELKDRLKLKCVRKENVVIKTFGNLNNAEIKRLEVVQFKVKHRKSSKYVLVEALCVPDICSPIANQKLDCAKKLNEFSDLVFADVSEEFDLSIGVLVGIDFYFRFFTGKRRESKEGVVACESSLGWILSGSVVFKGLTEVTYSHQMRVEVQTVDPLDAKLHKFWQIEEAESAEDNSVINQFTKDIYHDGTRMNKIGILADIKQAFLNISIHPDHRDFLRFLWRDPSSSDREIVVYRFLRVVFGLTSSPFLLNGTIRQHMSKYLESDKAFVEQFLSDLYVDDITTGTDTVESGILTPITARVKTIFQLVCKVKCGWDDKVPPDIACAWYGFLDALESVKIVEIDRFAFVSCNSDTLRVELHGFCDSSEILYCSVVYLRVISETGISIFFLTSKSKVAPLKKVTIPRLELLSCVLLSDLLNNVRSALSGRISVDATRCWSDSKVALCWIKGNRKTWKPWVENRVVSARKVVQKADWHHIPGKDNPADIPTRMVPQFKDAFCEKWFKGPEILFDEDKLSSFLSNESSLLDTDKSDVLSEARNRFVDFDGRSSYDPFECKDEVLITALVYRFVSNIKAKCNNSHVIKDVISSEEQEAALTNWIKEEQRLMKSIPTYRKLTKSLGVFEKDNLLRVRGRFDNADITTDQKHPILIRNATSPFTKLVIWNSHERTKHQGIDSTLADVRRRYWIVQGRKAVKNTIRQCVVCIRFQGRTLRSPPTADLPDFRDDFHERSFNSVGMDFAGPLYFRNFLDNDKTKKDSLKCYIPLLTCATSRAVHLELVPDLSKESFIRAFKRFVARRERSTNRINVKLVVGDIVLVKDDTHLPRSRWPIAKVEELVSGKDGNIRGAKLSTVTKNGKRGSIHRPLAKIIPFEIVDNHQQTPETPVFTHRYRTSSNG
ncbi:uncharacterized protein [Clytia hemisphaerica]|uniref:uncharacterized protein n=1 Tax=Clytia hemisphaerica TaxID=252671 RepID=UPI0034D4BD2B